jgi:hypothetical protein
MDLSAFGHERTLMNVGLLCNRRAGEAEHRWLLETVREFCASIEQCVSVHVQHWAVQCA